MSPAARALADCHSIADLRRLARRRLPRAIFDFYDGGAEDERTLAANADAFAQWWFTPRVLRDVSCVSTRCKLLGTPAGLPLAIGPTGGANFGHRDADLALARAAAKWNIPFTLSSAATTSIEEIARRAPGRHWFQAYVLRDRDFFGSLLERAKAADYEALMITVDLPVGGKRERDLRHGLRMPMTLGPRQLMGFAARPRWALELLARGVPALENLRGLETPVTERADTGSSVGRHDDPAFDWDGLHRVRDRWPRRLIVKGAMHPGDAARLVELGVDALVVSNHGGRQLDGALPSLVALPAVLRAVDGRIPVFLDGGIRRGSDIVKALALGAAGVLLGRATLFGAVAAGDAGALRALGILNDELVRTMRLCGATALSDIARPMIRQLDEDRVIP